MNSDVRGTSKRSLRSRNRSLRTPLSETTVYILGRLYHEAPGVFHDHRNARRSDPTNPGIEPRNDPGRGLYNRFKSIAPLTGFNNYALVARFKAGLNPSLGFEVIKNGAPADDNLDAWYDRSTELA